MMMLLIPSFLRVFASSLEALGDENTWVTGDVYNEEEKNVENWVRLSTLIAPNGLRK